MTRKTALVILFLSLFLCACGKKGKSELEVYKASMETFFQNISMIDTKMNEVDVTSETASADMLNLLDTLEDQFKKMAELKVPASFSNVEELADQASENMSNAVSYYHQAYDGETFEARYEEVADKYYAQANKRLHVIIQLLRGEEIDDPSVAYEE